MLRKIFATGIAMAMAQITHAQDSSGQSGLVITGSADIYYRFDAAQKKTNNLTSFTGSHNSFEPGMASLKFAYKTKKVEALADLGFGRRAQEFSYNDQGLLAAVKQMFISYSAATWLKLTAGSWATHVGFESVDPHLNRNYSMSYLFTNGPFFHTGIKAEISLQNHGLMLGMSNATDFKYVPEGFIKRKFILAQYSFTYGEGFRACFNYVAGKNIDTTRSHQFDLVLSGQLGEKFSLACNSTITRARSYLGNKSYGAGKTWWGSAFYLMYDPSEQLGLTLRQEYFNDHDRLKTFAPQSTGGSVFASTLSASFKTDHFIFIPELRLDRATGALYSARNGKLKRSAVNLLFAAIYHF